MQERKLTVSFCVMVDLDTAECEALESTKFNWHTTAQGCACIQRGVRG